jgi:hypothetical protein
MTSGFIRCSLRDCMSAQRSNHDDRCHSSCLGGQRQPNSGARRASPSPSSVCFSNVAIDSAILQTWFVCLLPLGTSTGTSTGTTSQSPPRHDLKSSNQDTKSTLLPLASGKCSVLVVSRGCIQTAVAYRQQRSTSRHSSSSSQGTRALGLARASLLGAGLETVL